MQDAKEEVRARLDIEEVIGEYVQLKRAGRSFKGLSPFSGEKTPSFFVSPDKQIWHDFSSNRGGDIFSFVMEVEGLDFRGALELLARKAGVDLSQYSHGDKGLADRKKRLREANELAANYYQHCLVRNQHALQYVTQKRGLNKTVIESFRLGYAPTNGNDLTNFLTKKGFTRKELADAGLTNRFGSDLFRGRMTVPLMDATGQVIGFTGRIIIDDPKAPKYLNTPQTLLYDKGRHVFGLSQAKEAIRTQDKAVVVEGNLDVVSSYQADVREVVATAGTAMTEHHLKALKRLTSRITLAFDGDKAGLAATERAIPIAQAVGVDIFVATLPATAKDPDELIQTQSVSAWRAVIDVAEPVVDWVLGQYALRENMHTAAGKRAFTSAALAVVKNLQDPVEQEYYVKKIAAQAETSVTSLNEKQAQSQAAPKSYKQPRVHPRPSAPDQHDKRVTNLLSVAALHDDVRALLRQVETTIFEHDDEQAVAAYLQRDDTVADTMQARLPEYEKYVTMVLLNPDIDRLEWQEAHRLNTARDVIRGLQATYQKLNKKDHLVHEEALARSQGDIERANTLLLQINALIKGEK